MLLKIHNLKAGYGKKEVLHGVSFFLNKGERVVLLGHNGAGKTTTLKAIFGLLQAREGSIEFLGEPVSNHRADQNVCLGMVYVPQERNVFPNLSVLENLELTMRTIKQSNIFKDRLIEIYELFPILKERKKQRAGTLSGGEQKMLALASALITHPQLILLDEPSLGLSPLFVKKLMQTVEILNKELNMTILLVEQNIKQALSIAQRVYVMKIGQITLESTGADLLGKGDLWKLL